MIGLLKVEELYRMFDLILLCHKRLCDYLGAKNINIIMAIYRIVL